MAQNPSAPLNRRSSARKPNRTITARGGPKADQIALPVATRADCKRVMSLLKGSAKPLFGGSIPPRASNLFDISVTYGKQTRIGLSKLRRIFVLRSQGGELEQIQLLRFVGAD